MQYNFQVRAGNSGTSNHDIGLEVAVKTKVNTVLEPFDLTGYEVVFIARVSAKASPLIRKSSLDGDVIVEALAGKVLVPLSPDETRLMLGSNDCNRTIYYEIERRKTSPVIQRPIVYGQITVVAGVNDD